MKSDMAVSQEATNEYAISSARNEPPKQTRDLLRIILLLRTGLALLLSILFFGDLPPALLGSHFPDLFGYTLISYLTFVLISALVLKLGIDTAEHQSYFATFIDIVAFTLLMHASGGLRSGLGMLIAISIASSCLLIRGRNALLFAALGTLAILTEQVYSHFNHSFATTAYSHAGLLGASFFAIAILAEGLSRRLTETESQASQHRLDLANLAQLNEHIIQHMQTGVIVVDGKDRIRLKNEAAWSLLGLTNQTSQSSLKLACSPLWEQFTEWRQQGGDGRRDFRASEGGRDIQANFVRLSQTGQNSILVFLEDGALVTERAQQMKLASLGRLTASIAHEIRNPLGAISHAGQLLEESPQLSEHDQRLTEIIRNNSQRMNTIIENVLQLSRRNPSQFQELEIHPWLEEFIQEYQHDHNLDPKVLRLTISPADTRIRIDPTHLRQILTNLIDNAVRHFEGDGRQLRLAIEGGITSESGGPFLQISDNGPGIDEAAQRHIFEPFFTTGHTGTGLGLYIARELCETNRARLEYYPGLEGGSCFRISFPGLRKKVFNP